MGGCAAGRGSNDLCRTSVGTNYIPARTQIHIGHGATDRLIWGIESISTDETLGRLVWGELVCAIATDPNKANMATIGNIRM